MSIRKTYLPELKEIETFYERAGLEDFAKRYAKVEIFIGPSDSIDFINEKLEAYYSKDKKEMELVGRSV